MMQKALLAEYPQAIPLAFNLWAESKVSIDETYHMMPISAVRSTLGAVGEKPSWPDSFPLLKHWLQFVYKHRSEDAGFSDGQVIDVLRRNRHVAEVVHFLDWLRNEPDMKMEAFVLLPTLAVKLSKSAELEPLFGAWLKLKVNPVEAYHRMGISGEKRFGYVLSMIKDWVYYLRKYRSEVGGFGDDQVVQVLTDDRDRVDCLKIFMWLRFLPGMKEDADLFQRSLILGSSDPAEMLQLVFDVWQKSKVSPEEVYKVVPISTEDGTFGTLREGSDPPITYRLHKCWVRYLGKHQSEVDGFGDDKAIGILLKDRPDVGEVVNFLNWLRDEPGMKMHADLLQRALIARFWESAKILELVFGAWQKTKVSFDEAYHMMPISAVRSTSGAVGGKPSWRDSFPFLKHWLQFMYKHRSEDAGFSEGQVIDVLLRNQNVVEVVDFLIWLRNESGMKACADLLLKTLFFKLSESTKELKLVFVAWQRNKVSLDDAYHMLPNSATQNLGGDAGLQSSSSGDFGVLKAWLDHLYKLPGDNLRDDRVAELLVSNRPKAELEKLCEVLNYQPKTRKLAVTLKKKVALRWPVL
ncbi:unnamed protein product [Hyaloperonospora brassicae]|uniref:RXLR phytopathogen effector protein WY-domain domain-containing protein n=1 Tax=Hyaloperonospora brassicae TaxID=162125 RepID=A0AAV0USV1_HYABA|nr:unnamed protein product [Hyaloperonospora brassicae]